MKFTFYPDIIPDVGEAEVISGETPFHFSRFEYLVVQENGEKMNCVKNQIKVQGFAEQ